MAEGNSHFLMALGRHDGGAVVETADAQLREVIRAVRQTGKKGRVTVTMDVAPNGDEGFETTFTVKASAPKLQFARSFYFTNEHGDLTRTPPRDVAGNLLKFGE